jgi:4-hydroxy-tetrahydrodipicolinate synthase
MRYRRQDAKQHARQHFTGLWAAIFTPFDAQLRVDEEAFRANLDHWIGTLKLGGLFLGGKQAEYFSLSIAERKRQFLMGVQAAEAAGERGGAGRAGIITSCSDTQLDTVLELARYSQDIGADYVIVHSPVLHFGADTDETIYEYYRYLSEQLEVGIALWNHPDCGYTMSPELCARIADLPNIVAIKYSTDRERCRRLTELAGDRIQVSNPDEEHWLDNIIEFGWRLYLCSTPPFLLQTAVDQRINEYTRLAFSGDLEAARRVSDSLQPVREAYRNSRTRGKPQAHGKAWLDCLGQHGGPVRRPLLQMTDPEIQAVRDAVARSGLRLS